MSTQSKKITPDWTQALEAEVSGDNEAVVVFVKDRSGEAYRDIDGNPAVVHVLGQYSDAMKAFDRKQRRVMQKAVRTGQMDDDLTRQTAERLAAATTGWTIAFNGAAVPFTQDNAITLYMHAEWIADQVWAAVRAHTDFLSAKSGN
jgi:hypothetical protein